ncbi:MAG: NAD(P)/FAD-dependent oxidoreductase, partial [Methanosarcinales archaeon]|nr:NAD(P)/FAD-dependent oxidoreductase [Methanosarcinales archaeon]
MHVDIAVVGAGPTGAIAAKHALAHGDGSVLVIEEHASIGSPVQCTGLLSTRALQECGCSPKNDYVLNSLRGAYLYSPDGTRLVIDGKKTKAYVVDRSMFDRELVMRSVD